jgi:hypothetical protein
MWRVALEPGNPDTVWGTSNPGHLSDNELEKFKTVTDDAQIVLFHFVTRSQNDFMTRKINLRSGVYATEFKNMTIGDGSASGEDGEARELPSGRKLDGLYARFERDHGFDGDYPVCRQGAALTDAVNAAVARGWSELD